MLLYYYNNRAREIPTRLNFKKNKINKNKKQKNKKKRVLLFMGFGLLIIGYISVAGFFPDLFIYYSYTVYIAVAGGIIMLMGFVKLQEYNIYFKIMKYICIAYILILLGFTPFVVPRHGESFMQYFMYVSKIIRIFFLFIFHYFLLSGILSLAKSINNAPVTRGAKRNIIITYIYFFATILGIFSIFDKYYIMGMMVFGLVYYFMTMAVLFSCYMRITYEGYDEAVDEKNDKKAKRTERTDRTEKNEKNKDGLKNNNANKANKTNKRR